LIHKLGENAAAIKVGDMMHAFGQMRTNELVHLGLQEGYTTV